MGKKHLKGGNLKKRLLSQVRNRIYNGEDREDVFKELCSEYIERDWLASIVSRVPNPEDLSKMRIKNNFIICSIFIWVAFSLLEKLGILLPLIYENMKFSFMIPLALFWPTVAIWMAIKIRKYDGLFYKFLGFAGIIVILKAFQGLAEWTPSTIFEWTYLSVYLSVVSLGTILSFMMKKQFFPHITFTGVKKVGDRYIVGRELI